MGADKGGEGSPERTIVAREGSDVCHMVFIGDIDGAEMQRILDAQKEVMAGCDYALLLIDMTRLRHATPEARKIGAEARTLNAIGAAIFGASFAIRVLAKLVTTAGAILRKTKPGDIPQEFFETEEEAVAWLNHRRAEYLKARP